jgi:hypothetical protein
VEALRPILQPLQRHVRRLFLVGPVALALTVLAAPAKAQRAVSETFEDARAKLGRDFVERETARFIVLSDAGRRETQRYAEYLELSYHQFHRFCRRIGLEPKPLRHKLVVVLFERRAQYRAFARKHDDVTDMDLAGYYSPTNDRVVVYDVQTNPSVEEARTKLSDMRTEIDDLAQRERIASREGRAAEASSLRVAIGQYEDHLQIQSRRVEDFTAQTSIATTVHEAVHQLMFHTGIQSRHVEYPLWLSEGLATSFETHQPGHAFGPDHEYEPRREEFRRIMQSGGLLPIDQLIRASRATDLRPDQVHILYHQSYALITWLTRTRPRDLATLLQLIADEPGGRPTDDRHAELFEQAFGSIEALERRWLSWESSH